MRLGNFSVFKKFSIGENNFNTERKLRTDIHARVKCCDDKFA